MTVPVRLAQGATESGPDCLGMLLAGRGMYVGQETLRVACGVGRDGTDLNDLCTGANAVGAEARVVSATLDDLPLPAIIRWGAGLSRVIEGRKGNSWLLIDPFQGRMQIDDAQVRSVYDGNGLILDGPHHSTAHTTAMRLRRWRVVLADITTRMRGSFGGVLFVVLAGLALIAPGLVTPALVRMFVDSYLSAGDAEDSALLVVALVIALLFQVSLTALQLLGLRRLLTATVTRETARFVWHVLRMPAWFYAQRDATTLNYRVGLNEQWAEVLAGRLTAALLAQMTSVFYLVIMVIFSPILAAIAALGLLLSIVLVWRIAKLRSEVRQRQAREQSVLATQLGISLRMLETLKATGSEDIAFARVYGSLGRVLSLGHTSLWAYLGMVPVLASTLTSAAVLGVGAALVMSGSLTLGTLTAFTLLLAGFLAPIAVIVPALDSALNLRGAWEQLDDVLTQAPDEFLRDPEIDGDPSQATSNTPESDHATPTSGSAEPHPSAQSEDDEEDHSVEDDLAAIVRGASRRRRRGLSIDPWAAAVRLENVSYAYAPGRPPQIRDINVDLSPGRMLAIVGASGGGKSTLGRIIAGLYHPTGGRITLDRRDYRDLSQIERVREIAFVDQDVVAYQATVRENLTMFDPTVPDRYVIAAAQDAHIHDDILARPGGYESLLAEDGSNVSGGQRQRLVIARALVRQPRLIVLDEATSALDARTEAAVVERLRARGCTIVLIAHRLSTVRDADEILVMNEGVISEQGTHAALITSGGLYSALMSP
jgi:ABC-type bacteriocin/lantibiotic exporter with double-glycine peptidase domain